MYIYIYSCWSTVRNVNILRGICPQRVWNLIFRCLMILLFYSFESFSLLRLLMVSHWSLSDCKTKQFARTLQSMLAYFSYVVVWMVSTCPLISKSLSTFTSSLGIDTSAPMITGITVTFMCYSCFLLPFFSHFCFLFIAVRLIFVLFVIFLVNVTNIFCCF